jgi:hypothetical protein
MRVYRITLRNAPAGIVIGAIALVVGGVLLTLRASAFVIRRLSGRPTVRPLDPRLEVFPPSPPGSPRSPDSPASRAGATALPVSRDAPRDRGSTG